MANANIKQVRIREMQGCLVERCNACLVDTVGSQKLLAVYVSECTDISARDAGRVAARSTACCTTVCRGLYKDAK